MIINRSVTLLINELSTFIAEEAEKKINLKMPFSLFLSGGNSPRKLYNNLPDYIKTWENIHLFLGDERYVPDSSSDSNRKMIYEFLINRIDIPKENIHFPITTVEPFKAAEMYDLDIKKYLEKHKTFDIMLMGVGQDCHTLSLFPFSKALNSDNFYSENLIENTNSWRLTSTFKLLSKTSKLLVLVTDKNKQCAIDKIFDSSNDIRKYPAKFLKNLDNVIWYFSDEIKLKHL